MIRALLLVLLCFTASTAQAADVTITGTLGVSGAATLSGNTSVGGTLGVTGTTTLNNGTFNGSFSGTPTFAGNVAFTQSGNAPSGTMVGTTYNLNSAPSTGFFQQTRNQTNITASVSGKEQWFNFDNVVHNVPGGDTWAGPATNIVVRYIGGYRSTAAPNIPMLGMVINTLDTSGLSSASGGTLQPLELDISANGNDDGGTTRSRQSLSMVFMRGVSGGAAPSFAHAIGMYGSAPDIQGVFNPIYIGVPFRDAGIDFRGSSTMSGGTGNAIWLKTGQNITWDTAGSANMRFDTSTFSGSGGIHVFANLQVDGTFYLPNSMTVGGAAFMLGAAVVAGAGHQLGFYGATAVGKQTPTGACAGNTGCQALRDALGNLGLINTGSISN